MPTAAAFLLLFIRAALSTPSLSFPINSQVPPIARTSQSFSYQFAANTFTSSDQSSINYTTSNAPAWLSLKSSSRTFTGTPQSQDQGPFSFQLTATDDSGSSSAPVTLVVENSPSPTLNANITSILSSSTAGALSGLNSLNLLPNSTFGINFPPDTFMSSGPLNVTYYATSADRSPLPSWINFNSESLTLSGVTPPPVPNPQTIPLRLLVSTVSGFSDDSLTFNVIVSDHTLAFSSVNQSIMVQPNQPFPSSSLQLLADGQPVQPSYITSASIDGPTWLKIDPKTLSLSGTVPGDTATADAHIRATDIYGNVANTYISIASPLDARSPSSTSSSSASNAMATPSSGSTAPPAPTSSNTAATAPSATSTTQSKSQGWIAAAVIVPTAVAIALVVLVFLLCRRRERRKQARRRDQQPPRYQAEKQAPSLDIERDAVGNPLRVSRVSDDSLGSHNQLVLDGTHFTLGHDDTAPYHSSPAYPPPSRQRSTQASTGRVRGSRGSRASQRSGASASMSDSRRMTGLGHGRLPSLGTQYSPLQADSLMRTMARRRCTQCGSSDVETLTSSSPSTAARRSRPLSDALRPSIRMLPPERTGVSTPLSQPSSKELIQDLLREVGEIDTRPFEEKRASYLGKKTRARYRERAVDHREKRSRTHDEMMFDLQTSYDRLKRELGSGSYRGKDGSSGIGKDGGGVGTSPSQRRKPSFSNKALPPPPRALLPPPSFGSLDGQRLRPVDEVADEIASAGAEEDEEEEDEPDDDPEASTEPFPSQFAMPPRQTHPYGQGRGHGHARSRSFPTLGRARTSTSGNGGGGTQPGSHESNEWTNTSMGSSHARSSTFGSGSGSGKGTLFVSPVRPRALSDFGPDRGSGDRWEDDDDEEFLDDEEEEAVFGQAEAIGIATTADVALEEGRPMRRRGVLGLDEQEGVGGAVFI